eukprot:g3850.t1
MKQTSDGLLLKAADNYDDLLQLNVDEAKSEEANTSEMGTEEEKGAEGGEGEAGGEDGSQNRARKPRRAQGLHASTKLTVTLQPRTGRNCMQFETRAFKKASKGVYCKGGQKRAVILTKFDHVPGCKVCEHTFQHYRLPDGRLAHFFNDVSVHELDAAPEPPPQPVTSLADIAGLEFPKLPGPLAPPASWAEMFAFATPKAEQLVPPWPKKHTLPVDAHGCPGALCPLFGILPDDLISFSVGERTEAALRSGGAKSRPPYEPPVFLPRKATADSSSLYDGRFDANDVFSTAFELDWARCIHSPAMQDMLVRYFGGTAAQMHAHGSAAGGRGGGGGGGGGSASKATETLAGGSGGGEAVHFAFASDAPVLQPLRSAIEAHGKFMFLTFDYYATLGSGHNFSIQLNGFTTLLNDCAIPMKILGDPGTLFHHAGVTMHDSQEDKLPIDVGLLRFQFLTVLLLTAVQLKLATAPAAANQALKFGGASQAASAVVGVEEARSSTSDVFRSPAKLAEAIGELFSKYVVRNMPSKARDDGDEFREKILYHHLVNNALEAALPQLRVAHAFFSTARRKVTKDQMATYDAALASKAHARHNWHVGLHNAVMTGIKMQGRRLS